MRFEVTAVGAGGAVVRLMLDAVDEQDATAQACAHGNRVLTVTARRAWLAWRPQRRAQLPLALFCQELMALLESGLALLEAMETLAEKEARPETRRVLEQVAARLREGHPLSFALAESSTVFPPLFTATVRASESSGALPQALARYLRYQEQVDAVLRHVTSALVYPAVLGVVGVLVTVFLLVYVVPRFSQVYADTGAELPLSSRILVGWGQLLANHALACAAAGIGAVWLCWRALRRPATRRWLMRRVWSCAPLGERLRLFYLARLYRSLGMLLRGGMPVAAALALAGGVLEPGLRARLEQAAARIREGQPISRALPEQGLATPVAQRMLVVGERTGAMGELMERIAAFYEDDMARWVERFTRLFEPILMVAIGAVIGCIVVLMYMPVFDLAGSIG
ncbi:type II secretion system F family protein [Massilia horti]|uniref:Type II secretion system F family protein n=1 Tax=Massilia horti TaxID=2562153 RepID=A0A4Y9T3Q1_9BURK|nr:type II secretion system F family protein [Massilia horti]TFW32310.1 type II secretion system F family protein [Massilia horti]